LQSEAAFRERKARAAEVTAIKPPEQKPVSWQDISTIFLSDERVQVKCVDRLETLNYGELGFADGRTGKPDSAWTGRAGTGTSTTGSTGGERWAQIWSHWRNGG
jgi:hypothetical protein